MRRPATHRRHSIRRTTNILRSLRAGGLAGLAFVALLVLAAPPAQGQVNPDSSVVLQWTAPGDDGTSGRASVYDIRYRTTAISGTDTTTWWNGATQVSGDGTGPTPYALNYVGRYDRLRDDLIAWDRDGLHGLGANYFGLAASAFASGSASITIPGPPP